jgi:hypothetical protein
VADEETRLIFYRAGSSTFSSNLPSSPALENDRFSPSAISTFVVAAKPFSSIDDGSIDILSIDIEGGEWFVLKHIKSTPLVISIETHGKCYRNPFLHEIRGWMKRHGYVVWYFTNSDTVFIKKEIARQTFNGRLSLFLKQRWIVIFRWSKRLCRLFKNR